MNDYCGKTGTKNITLKSNYSDANLDVLYGNVSCEGLVDTELYSTLRSVTNIVTGFRNQALFFLPPTSEVRTQRLTSKSTIIWNIELSSDRQTEFR